MKSKKTNTKKTVNNSKKQLKENPYLNEIYGIITIAMAILTLLSIFTTKTGLVGSLIKKLTFSFMGVGAYIFPLILLFIGVILIFDGFKEKGKLGYLYLFLVFISLLVIFDNINPLDLSFVERIENSIDLAIENSGGGIIGSFFGYFMYKLFGTIGTYLITAIILLIFSLLITNTQVKHIVKILREKFSQDSKPEKDKKIPIYNRSSNINDQKKPDQQAFFSNQLVDGPLVNKENKEAKEVKEKSKDLVVETTIEATKVDLDDAINKSLQDNYIKPSIDLLKAPDNGDKGENEKEIYDNANRIKETMNNFGIDAEITAINIGPTITCYELQPAPGIKLSRIVSLSDNISLSLASPDIRIEAPIPGKSVVGIEVPNRIKSSVYLKEVISSNEYNDLDTDLPLGLGKDVSGKTIISAIDKMPHLLIAGATGSGKSVCINTIIMSILYKSSPEEVKLLLIDPKVVELSVYNGIPHLLIPVVTDAKKASYALNWAVSEMESRYKTFAQNNVRDIFAYNNKQEVKEDRMSKIVIIIDELADLMMVAASEIEDYICRLAQMARAAGIYLIVATQRPSVDVITGTIKANIPSRISFAVSSQVDSRTILDMAGAEKLLGKGDMLFFPSFYSKPVRIQGAFISDREVEDIVNSLKTDEEVVYDDTIIEVIENPKDLSLDDNDDLFMDAVSLVLREEQASISFLQRKLKIGYARAARLVDSMEDRGIVSSPDGNKPRKVLIDEEDLEIMFRGE